MLSTLHLITDNAGAVEEIEQRIDGGAGPGDDQRTAGLQDAVNLAESSRGLGQVLQNRQHYGVIEISGFDRQTRGDIGECNGDAMRVAGRKLFVQSDSKADAPPDPAKKLGIQAAADIAHRCLILDVRQRRAKAQPGDEAIKGCIGHGSGQRSAISFQLSAVSFQLLEEARYHAFDLGCWFRQAAVVLGLHQPEIGR